MAKFRSTASASNPFAAAPERAPAEETPNILDLFGNSINILKREGLRRCYGSDY